jgi:hypothetical protein
MEIAQHIAELDPPLHHSFFREKTFGFTQDYFQVFTVDIFQDEVRTIVMGEIIVDTRDCWMIQGGKQVGLSLKVPDDRAAHQLIPGLDDHFFHGYQLDDIWKVQVSSTVDCAHPAHTNHILN